MRFDVLLLGLTLTGLLAWTFRRDQQRARAWRAGLLLATEPLLSGCICSFDRPGFPVLNGEFRGQLAEVSLFADAIGLRRLPSLWISVTLKAPIPGAATVDLLARPQNIEFYSPAETLPHRLYPPLDWPQHVQIKSDTPDAAALFPIQTVAKSFFTEPNAKEMLITPRGVRLVYMVEQGRRGDYLLLRAARFDVAGIAPETVARLLEQATELRRALTMPRTLDHAA